MEEIGRQLQSVRLAKGLSLEDIHRQTKIGQEYLQALESGDWQRLALADPYIKGFIRSYARAVDWDPGPVLKRFDQHRAEQRDEHNELAFTSSQRKGIWYHLNQTLQWLGL